MNTGSSMQTPPCFGDTKLWSAVEPECAGGPDPKYVEETTGSHIRRRCSFFESCGNTVAKKQQILSAHSLIRPGIPLGPIPAPAVNAPPQRTAMTQAPPTPQQLIHSFMQQRPPTVAQPPQVQYYQQPQPQGPVHSPASVYQLNYAMPAYLSVPEQRQPNQGILSVLGREMVRAMGKSLGHTIAHFFDMNPFKLPPGQGGQGS